MKKIKQRKNPSKTNLSTVILPLTPHSVLSSLCGYATPGSLRFVFAIFWTVVADVHMCCTAGSMGCMVWRWQRVAAPCPLPLGCVGLAGLQHPCPSQWLSQRDPGKAPRLTSESVAVLLGHKKWVDS